jgi:AcrR family transcriptional regulator
MGGMRAAEDATRGGGGRTEATRRKLLDAADRLFYADGIRSTGVAAVAEGAGVTKMTFYAHFASKDELVCAYLRERDARWRKKLRGCAFVNCAAEFPDREHPARRAAREHKAAMRRRLAGLAAEAGAEDSAALAEGLFVLLEGAYVTAALEGDEGVVERARELGAEMVAAATGRGEGPRV